MPGLCRQAVERVQGRKKWFGKRDVLPGVGLYLDGGFGVARRTCRASACHYQAAWNRPDADMSKAHSRRLRAVTQLAGGLASPTVSICYHHRLCIDEFELDDPATPR